MGTLSNSGNISGANKLQQVLGPDIQVHLLQGVYSYMHIDTTIAFLREGLPWYKNPGLKGQTNRF